VTRIKLVVDGGSGPLLCDRPGCDREWPGEDGRKLPGGWRIAGFDELGRLVLKLFCSTGCAAADTPKGTGS
jgi:hypothetical protein